MADNESYLTKENPSAEDWVAENADLFTALKERDSVNSFSYAPFVDVDRRAAEAGVTVKEYFEQIRSTVGPLGEMALQLVHSEMDDAWHIIIALDEPTDPVNR